MSETASERWAITVALRRRCEDQLVGAYGDGEPLEHLARELHGLEGQEKRAHQDWVAEELPHPMELVFGRANP